MVSQKGINHFFFKDGHESQDLQSHRSYGGLVKNKPWKKNLGILSYLEKPSTSFYPNPCANKCDLILAECISVQTCCREDYFI